MTREATTAWRQRRRRGGMTLVELVVASASAVILLFGLMSCFLIAGRALDEDRLAPARQIKTAHNLDPILIDARDAMVFSERMANAVTFKVPDRDGDTLGETIRYSWSGTAGDPLMVEYNGGAPAVFIEAVTQFALDYRLRTASGTGFVKGIEYANEELLALHEDAPGGHFASVNIMSSLGYALYFEPNLPAETTQWDLTRMEFYMKRSSNPDGDIAIQIRPPAGAPELGPSETVLEEVVIHESVLANVYDWHDFSYDTVIGRPAGEGLFVVIKQASVGGTVVAVVQTETGIDDQPGMAAYRTEDAGESWLLLSSTEMVFHAYGIAH